MVQPFKEVADDNTVCLPLNAGHKAHRMDTAAV